MFILSKADSQSIMVIKEALEEFKKISGLQLNLQKCEVYIYAINSHEKWLLADTLGMLLGSLPIKYLRSSSYCWETIILKLWCPLWQYCQQSSRLVNGGPWSLVLSLSIFRKGLECSVRAYNVQKQSFDWQNIINWLNFSNAWNSNCRTLLTLASRILSIVSGGRWTISYTNK